MLKVGVPEAVDPDLLRLLPKGISLELIPVQPERKVEVEFWIIPPWTHQAEQQCRFLQGLRVAQATVAGVDGLLKLIPPSVVLCDARGVHTIPTAEWTVAAILAWTKYLSVVRRSAAYRCLDSPQRGSGALLRSASAGETRPTRTSCAKNSTASVSSSSATAPSAARSKSASSPSASSLSASPARRATASSASTNCRTSCPPPTSSCSSFPSPGRRPT